MLSALAQHRIALRRSEEQRRAAMRRDYVSRGWSPPSIEQLIAQRLDDEFPVIQASLVNADIILDNGQES
jgi:hypothetical protein